MKSFLHNQIFKYSWTFGSVLLFVTMFYLVVHTTSFRLANEHDKLSYELSQLTEQQRKLQIQVSELNSFSTINMEEERNAKREDENLNIPEQDRESVGDVSLETDMDEFIEEKNTDPETVFINPSEQEFVTINYHKELSAR